jgi:hypothetical protein
MSKQEFESETQDQAAEEETVDPNAEPTGTSEATSEETETAFVAESSSAGRSAGIIMFAFVVIGGAIIYVMRMRSGPQTASANPEAVNATDVVTKWGADGNKSIIATRELMKNTEDLVKGFKKYSSPIQVKLEDLKVNPFLFTETRADTSAEDAAKKAEHDFQVAKEAVMKDAQQLKLQSIISGTIKSCMISNTMYEEGQLVEGFKIEQITPRSVIIVREINVGKKHDTVKLQLQINR